MDAKVEIIFMIQNIFYVKLSPQISLKEYEWCFELFLFQMPLLQAVV